MHEFNIIQNIFAILEQLADENHLRVIKKVTLRIGRLRQIVPETMRFAFKTLSAGTVADSAELIIEEIPIKIFCRSCHKTFLAEDNIYICPHCQETDLEVLTGKEITLASIDGEP